MPEFPLPTRPLSSKLYEALPGKKGRLWFHPGQEAAWNSKKRFIFVLAGTQGGKTSFGPWWLLREIETRSRPDELNDYLAVSANYDLFKLKMLPEMLTVFVDIAKIGRYWPSLRTIEIRDPRTRAFWAQHAEDKMYARIILRSAGAGAGEVGVSGLESATAKAAWLDECGLDSFSEVAWEAVLRRLSLSQGRVLGTTTLYNFDWLYHRVYTSWQQGDPDIDIISFDSRENPLFPEEEYERARRQLPEWKFNMLYRGVFDRPAGMIYQDYDEAVHVVDPFFIPHNWPQYVGIDPGAINTAVLWIAVNPDTKDAYVWKESIEGNLTSEEHCKRIKEIAQMFKGARVTYTGGAASEKQFRMDWQNHGIPVLEPSVHDVDSGIDRVITKLRSKHFFFFRTCTVTRAQMREYSRLLDDQGEPTEKIKDKEKYHLLDALRYAVSRMPGYRTATVPMSYIDRKPKIPGIGG